MCKIGLTLDTVKVTKADAPFWMAAAALSIITAALMVQLFLFDDFTPHGSLAMGIPLATVMCWGAVAVLVQGVKSPLSTPTNLTPDNALKARFQVRYEPYGFTLPEPLVL